MTTVALVGADGAGKSTVARRVADQLSAPTRVIYMGVNLEHSSLMLPTTRLALELKRARGRRPDLARTGDRAPGAMSATSSGPAGIAHAAGAAARLGTWLAEEWFHQVVAWWHQARGRIVIFDRHFYCDYHAAAEVAAPLAGRPWASRIHGFVLDRLYPRPDLVVCLDGPVETLYGRKPEGSLETRAELRQGYLGLADMVPRFALVDATRPVAEVVDVVRAIVERFVADGVVGNAAVDRAAGRLGR